MELIENEDGVSETVGFMLILLIIMIFMSMLQVYEVPKWNKDIEIVLFDNVRNDFFGIQHDINTAAIENVQITRNLHMGMRYPEHFMLRNPGPGASGTLTFEPINVNMTIGYDRTNYTSYRIKYKMNGISDQPEMIYEHGLIIRDFGSVQFNDTSQSIINENKIFLPLIFSQFQSVTSMTSESLNLMPVSSDDYYVNSAPSAINILLETNYPDLWNRTIGNISGVNLTNISGKWYINITKTVNTLMYPPNMSGGLYSGRITTELPESKKTSSATGGTIVVLDSDVSVASTTMVQVWSIPLTADKTNIVDAHLVTVSSSGIGVRYGVMTGGLPTGTSCRFDTPTSATASSLDILSTENRNTGENNWAWANTISVPVQMTCTCSGSGCGANLLIGLASENVNTVTAKSGSYYTLQVLP